MLAAVGAAGPLVGLVALALGRAHWRGGLIAAGLAQVLSGAATLSLAARAGSARAGPLPPIDRRALILLCAALPSALGALWGLVYILPVRDPGVPWLAAMLGLSALALAAAAATARHYGRDDSLGLAPAAAAWARAAALQHVAATVGLACTVLTPRWPILSPLEVWISLAQLGALLPLAAESLIRAAPAVWRWWRLRGPAPAQAAPVAAQVWWVRVPYGQTNPLQAILSATKRGFGVELRSTWALEVLRRAVEPTLYAAVAFAWLSSSLAMVHPDEQAIVERLGRALPGAPLEPGLHLLAPWPIDVVRRAPVRRVASIFIGHGEDEAGDGEGPPEAPESRLWARQHGKEEFTLLLGDGRDLVSLDGRLHYRVHDLRAWLYASQNPEETLAALTYEAVTRQTVDQTLDGVLSASVRALSAEVQAEVQAAADRRGLGVTVVEFTFTAMHPPVAVAVEYQSVVSAQIDRQTRVVRAQAAAAQAVPKARAEAHRATSAAEGAALQRLATARADAAAFTGLRAAARGDEQLYRFRRKLESIEQRLSDKPLIILDHRIEAQGGELWLKP